MRAAGAGGLGRFLVLAVSCAPEVPLVDPGPGFLVHPISYAPEVTVYYIICTTHAALYCLYTINYSECQCQLE